MFWFFRRKRPGVTVLYIKHAKDPGSVADPGFDLRGEAWTWSTRGGRKSLKVLALEVKVIKIWL